MRASINLSLYNSSFFLLFVMVGFLTSCSPKMGRIAEEEVNYFPPPQQGPLVVIDPGHGGKDLGTHDDLYEEKGLALSTSFFVEQYLQRLGYRTVMTRAEDIFIPLKERAEIANDLRAKAFVSMHYNSAENKSAHGIEVFFYQSKAKKDRSLESKKMAQNVLDQIISTTKAKSRGVKHGNFAVIRETNMPAIIVEGGFLTNTEERKKIFQPFYQRQIAWSVAVAIDQYLQSNRE